MRIVEEEDMSPGCITKIYMKNFMTYNEAVVRPGKHFNVIVGPNGSGKSSVVAAIALGLGGNQKTMGKLGSIGQFVRHGCDQAIITIDLYKPRGPCQITRIITSQNKTTWKYNNHQTDDRSIRRIIQEFNIQIDNLCQFLPQEQVQKFSALTPKELLINTEKSVTDGSLLKSHEALIKLRETQKELESKLNQTKTVLDMNTDVFKNLEETVTGIKEKKAMKKKLIALKQKRAWVIYDQVRFRYAEFKKETVEIELKCNGIQEALNPLRKKIEDKAKEVINLKKSGRDNNSKICNCNTKINQLVENVEVGHSNIKKIQQETKNSIDQVNDRNKEIALATKNKSKLENDLQLLIDDCGSEQQLIKNVDEIKSKTAKLREMNHSIDQSIFMETEKLRKCRQLIQNTNQMLSELKNIKLKKMEKLEELNNDAYKATLWLQSNLDKFKKPIHEPVLLDLEVTDPKYAMYFENLISHNDLTAFVCEDKDDMNRLLSILRDQLKLVVNVIHQDPMELINNQSNFPIEQLKKFGFQHYLISLIDAHPTILKFIIKMYRIQNIPIGSNVINDKYEAVPSDINLFFSPTTKYSVTVSRYSGAKSTRSSAIGKRGFLSLIMDKKSIQEKEIYLNNLQNQEEQLLNTINNLKEQPRETQSAINELNEKKNKFQEDLVRIANVKSRLKITINTLDSLQSECRSVEDIKNEAKLKITKELTEQINLYKNIARQYNAALILCKSVELYSHELKIAQEEEISAREESRLLENELTDIQHVLSDKQRDVKVLKRETEQWYEEALRETNGIKPDQAELWQQFALTFSKLPKTKEQLDEKIQQVQAKVYSTGDNDENGDNILLKYEKTQENIQSLERDIDNLKVQIEGNKDDINRARQEWLPVLESLVAELNKNFSGHLRKVGCVGEIKLHTGENPLDFDNYEIKIFVKFRDVDSLQEFNSHTQSGGERALTTGVYLTSLQELTSVPFRVVDEINQGMDGNYERHIFNILVAITSKPNGPQYFLLTPKLLPELDYQPHVDVLVVTNGPYNVKFNQWNSDTYIQRLLHNQDKD